MKLSISMEIKPESGINFDLVALKATVKIDTLKRYLEEKVTAFKRFSFHPAKEHAICTKGAKTSEYRAAARE